MNSACQPTLRFSFDPSLHGRGSVSACCLGPDWVEFFTACSRPEELLKSVFRVTVAETTSSEADRLPGVSGRYLLSDDEVQFVPHFPFERDLKYRASFDPQPLGTFPMAEPMNLEFLIPSETQMPARTEVTHIFPSSDLLPENLLRFYVCFSNSMQRGRALKEISLLDSDGQAVADALYRSPVELWDRTMKYLTVLLDPGRLKRWVGPNVELGPPLKVGQKYTLEIGSGMIDQQGRPLRKGFRKHFVAGDPLREQISVEDWKTLPPVTGSRAALVLMLPSPLDWALVLQSITVESAQGAPIDGHVVVDQSERRWRFSPNSPWIAGRYCIRVRSCLEDVCGNSVSGAFDRPLGKDPNRIAKINASSLTFRLT